MLTITSKDYEIKEFRDGHIILRKKGKDDYRVSSLVKVIDISTRQQFFISGEKMSIEPSYATTRRFSIDSINHTMNKLFGHLTNLTETIVR